MQRTALTYDDLRLLLENRDFPKVSIYLPVHGAGPEAQQDPIRLRNLLARAREGLAAIGARDADALLAPGLELLADQEFWTSPDQGAALFLSEGLFLALRLPLSFDELALVNDRFQVKQLLPYFETEGQFYVLAVSQNAARLIRCTRQGAEEMDVPGLPASMAETLQYDAPEKNLQPRGGAGGKRLGGKRRATYHGLGGTPQDAKDAEARGYMQAIDRALRDFLRDSQRPLVLAGVDELLAPFRAANTYAHFLNVIVPGNPDRLSAEELRQKAWPLVQPVFQQKQERALARYARLAGTGRASSQLLEVVPAAFHGRVEVLFVARGAQAWGVFDPRDAVPAVHDGHQPGDQDLLDYAAAYTLLKGGLVYTLPPQGMPAGDGLAAIMRY